LPNCHLAQKVELKYLKLFYRYCFLRLLNFHDTQVKQVLANGKRIDLNVGMVLILPEGFD
jgi:apocytochrome f